MTMTKTLEPGAKTVTRPVVTAEHAAFYRQNGYLALADALTPAEVQALRDETVNICRGKRGDVAGLPPVAGDDSDDDVIRRTLCVHFPHKLSPLMFDQLAQPSIRDVLTRIIGPNVKCMQSMLFIKSAGKPGQAWHQDEAFIPTRDRTLTGGWIALDDATVNADPTFRLPRENGAANYQRKSLMSTIEQDALERTDADAKLIGDFLDKKDASGPCLRCQNDKFYALELSETVYLIVCSHCGFKFEHVRSILIDPGTANSSTESEDEEQSQ